MSFLNTDNFPDYFKEFTMPLGAKEQEITAFRACATGCVDKESFTPSYEESLFQIPPGHDKSDPSVYSLSLFEKYRDIKRFMNLTSKYKKPYLIAVGLTHPSCGPCQRTKERLGKKTSHIDWWLYKGAEPHIHFKEFKTQEMS